MSDSIRIGTRNSPLAIWQAEFVKEYLDSIHIDAHLVFIKSEGDQNLTSPLYQMGIQGVFTKSLDQALLENKIDIAVHSLKDVPTSLADGLEIACIPPRANPSDTLVYKSRMPEDLMPYTVATSSLRRKAQWLYKYPDLHHTTSVRGNINTRVNKLMDHQAWDAIIFATAGLDRINLEVPNRMELAWMIPAPAQGALGITTRKSDVHFKKLLIGLHCTKTYIRVTAERLFLHALEGGCTMPIGALVNVDEKYLYLRACLLDSDGHLRMDIDNVLKIDNWQRELQLIIADIAKSDTYLEIKRRLKNE